MACRSEMPRINEPTSQPMALAEQTLTPIKSRESDSSVVLSAGPLAAPTEVRETDFQPIFACPCFCLHDLKNKAKRCAGKNIEASSLPSMRARLMASSSGRAVAKVEQVCNLFSKTQQVANLFHFGAVFLGWNFFPDKPVSEPTFPLSNLCYAPSSSPPFPSPL